MKQVRRSKWWLILPFMFLLGAGGTHQIFRAFPKGRTMEPSAAGPAAAPMSGVPSGAEVAKGLEIPCLAGTVGTKAYGNPNFFWKKNQFTIRFLDGDVRQQNMVKNAVQVWTQAANIKFVWVTNGNADIRISFLGKLYPGHWSRIGRDALNYGQTVPTMNIQLTAADTQDEYNRVARHEFGHALGLMHEHQHPNFNIQWNKPAVYAWYTQPPNGWSKQEVDEQVFSVYSGPFTGTPPDKDSIMMYPVLRGWTFNNFVVGWNHDLSAQDKSFIKENYP
jgi:serralysin